MDDLLTQTGLSTAQANVYLYLLENGEAAPPLVARKLSLTRTNAYKVLDSLVELALVRKTEINKKFVYRAEDPIALTSLVAAERNRVIALEQSVRDAMHQLRTVYEKTQKDYDVRTFRGNPAVTSLYVQQAKQGQPIYFIKSRADIPTMGYETMDRLRNLPAKSGTERYGITPDTPEAIANPAIDRKTNLTRTWMHATDYEAPVEWAVCGDELLIINFEKEASAIRIKQPVVARAFKELWQLLDRSLRADPQYKKLPYQAKRKV
ncbi:MAG TPA: helix-turn-helix domain-containing protein [Candidatus Limnocylindrales bacterium]|nr:helix-turn-helix domain-containing protein [Candidatus Limnocylindrales bacterium]